MRTITLALAVLALMGGGCGDNGHEPIPAQRSTRCPDIPFAPDTDNIATSIRIKNGTCDDAEALVRAVDEIRTPTSQDHTFDAGGYRCKVKREDDGLPVSRYECVDDGRIIGWERN